jgi:hypothetical protein
MLSGADDIICELKDSVESLFKEAKIITDAAMKLQDINEIYKEIEKLKNLMQNTHGNFIMPYLKKLEAFDPCSPEQEKIIGECVIKG